MRSKTLVFTTAAVALFALAAFGIARAQQTAPATPTAPSTMCPCMQPGMLGPGPGLRMSPGAMGGMGMMSGGGMQARTMTVRTGMMDSCPMMVSGATVDVKSIANGAVITITSADTKTARRIQIMAEMMKLRQELRSLQ